AGTPTRIDTRARRMELRVPAGEVAARRDAQDRLGWKPAQPRPRKVSLALKAYALLATSADKGAVRNRELLEG
ncbi:MAG TPA: dihydroxy-acid dehydratase, partial [Xanthomonadaceae bacterium]|nr:dihydroxy-acid dehydratase [Xanthomonadaceae bacterium]